MRDTKECPLWSALSLKNAKSIGAQVDASILRLELAVQRAFADAELLSQFGAASLVFFQQLLQRGAGDVFECPGHWRQLSQDTVALNQAWQWAGTQGN